MIKDMRKKIWPDPYLSGLNREMAQMKKRGRPKAPPLPPDYRIITVYQLIDEINNLTEEEKKNCLVLGHYLK